MTLKIKFAAAIAVAMFTFSAYADPIEIVALAGGQHPATLGGYDMTPFGEPTGTSSCASSPSGGSVCFEDYWGNSVALPAESPSWWEYDGTPAPDHGNIFVVRGYSWIDLVLPPNTRAISLFVGAESLGGAWLQAHDNSGYSTGRVRFRVDADQTSGYGIYATGCSSITRVTVEPLTWGFGYLSSNQGECQTVPEPAPIALLGIGLLGLALTRRLQTVRRDA